MNSVFRVSAYRGILGFLVFILFWYGLSILLSSPVLPFPHTVFTTTADLVLTEGLLLHTIASFLRAAAALLFAVLFAFPIGLFLGRSKKADATFFPLVSILYPFPKIALLPVALLLFGLGNAAKIFLVALVLFFQFLVVFRDAAKRIDENYIFSILSIGGGKIEIFRYVFVPAMLPEFFSVLKIAAGTALAVLFFSETFFTDWGLGHFIMDAWMRISYPEMYAGILSLGILGFLEFLIIDTIEKKTCPWRFD
ncbi:MAG: ABC transporter permease [Spirochaetia bacterium]